MMDQPQTLYIQKTAQVNSAGVRERRRALRPEASGPLGERWLSREASRPEASGRRDEAPGRSPVAELVEAKIRKEKAHPPVGGQVRQLMEGNLRSGETCAADSKVKSRRNLPFGASLFVVIRVVDAFHEHIPVMNFRS